MSWRSLYSAYFVEHFCVKQLLMILTMTMLMVVMMMSVVMKGR